MTETIDDSGFARPARYTIASPKSQLLDLAGLLGAYASVYALTRALLVEDAVELVVT